MYALVDCNNFFVSCERVFRPDLKGRPVVVLSSNDGCVVSRSAEAKKLGIPMGVPYFQYRDVFKKEKVTLFSGNFSLYGNFSDRVMTVLEQFTDDLQIYSIDEAFLPLPEKVATIEYGQTIKQTVEQTTKIPISVGIAETKVLAKLANYFAKKFPEYNGVCKITEANREELLAKVQVGEVWGIGPASARKLHDRNIDTALALTKCPNSWIKTNLTIHGVATAEELRGKPQFTDRSHDPKKGIVCSKSFGKGVTNFTELSEAVVAYTTHLGEKLREEKEQASYLYVFVRAGRSFKNGPQSLPGAGWTVPWAGRGGLAGNIPMSLGAPLPMPTDFTPDLVNTAVTLLKKIYRPNITYRKVGVGCAALVPSGSVQQNLFVKTDPKKQDRLMKAVDSVNRTFGHETIRYAGSGSKRNWQAKHEFRSPRYTAVLAELPVVK